MVALTLECLQSAALFAQPMARPRGTHQPQNLVACEVEVVVVEDETCNL